VAAESLATDLFVPPIPFLYINPTVNTETSLAQAVFSGNSLQMKSCVLVCIWVQQNGAGALSWKSHDLIAAFGTAWSLLRSLQLTL